MLLEDVAATQRLADAQLRTAWAPLLDESCAGQPRPCGAIRRLPAPRSLRWSRASGRATSCSRTPGWSAGCRWANVIAAVGAARLALPRGVGAGRGGVGCSAARWRTLPVARQDACRLNADCPVAGDTGETTTSPEVLMTASGGFDSEASRGCSLQFSARGDDASVPTTGQSAFNLRNLRQVFVDVSRVGPLVRRIVPSRKSSNNLLRPLVRDDGDSSCHSLRSLGMTWLRLAPP